ncbi:MAG: hypothetical protein AAF411_07320 [Myxococcota bacterium]
MGAMARDFYAASPHLALPIVALALFGLAFVAIAIRAVALGKDRSSEYASLALGDDAAEENKELSHG